LSSTKGNAPYNCESNFFLQSSWLHILISSGSIIYEETSGIYSVNYLLPFRINHGILTSLKGKSSVFWSWAFRNLGYCLTVIAWVCSWLWPRGPAPKAEKKCWTLCFHCTYAQNGHVQFFIFRQILLIDAPVRHSMTFPTRCYPSHLLLFATSYSNIIGPKLRDSFAHQVKADHEKFIICLIAIEILI